MHIPRFPVVIILPLLTQYYTYSKGGTVLVHKIETNKIVLFEPWEGQAFFSLPPHSE